MKYYAVTRFYDTGTWKSEVFTQEEMEEKSWVIHPSARTPGSSTVYFSRTMRIDEFNTLTEAQRFAARMRRA